VTAFALVRDRGEYQLTFWHSSFPMIDDQTRIAKIQSLAREFGEWSRENSCYGCGVTWRRSRVAPVFPVFSLCVARAQLIWLACHLLL
jgi:hypothetical protein